MILHPSFSTQQPLSSISLCRSRCTMETWPAFARSKECTQTAIASHAHVHAHALKYAHVYVRMRVEGNYVISLFPPRPGARRKPNHGAGGGKQRNKSEEASHLQFRVLAIRPAEQAVSHFIPIPRRSRRQRCSF